MKPGVHKSPSRQLRGSGLPRKLMLEYFHAKCKRCGSKEELEFDHVVPIEKGGQDKLSNLQLLCHKCHLKKHREENLLSTLPIQVNKIRRIQRQSLYRGYQPDFDSEPSVPRIFQDAPIWKDESVWLDEDSNASQRTKPLKNSRTDQ